MAEFDRVRGEWSVLLARICDFKLTARKPAMSNWLRTDLLIGLSVLCFLFILSCAIRALYISRCRRAIRTKRAAENVNIASSPTSERLPLLVETRNPYNLYEARKRLEDDTTRIAKADQTTSLGCQSPRLLILRRDPQDLVSSNLVPSQSSVYPTHCLTEVVIEPGLARPIARLGESSAHSAKSR